MYMDWIKKYFAQVDVKVLLVHTPSTTRDTFSLLYSPCDHQEDLEHIIKVRIEDVTSIVFPNGDTDHREKEKLQVEPEQDQGHGQGAPGENSGGHYQSLYVAMFIAVILLIY